MSDEKSPYVKVGDLIGQASQRGTCQHANLDCECYVSRGLLIVQDLERDGWQLAPPGSRVYGPDDVEGLAERIEQAWHPDAASGRRVRHRVLARIAARLVCGGNDD